MPDDYPALNRRRLLQGAVGAGVGALAAGAEQQLAIASNVAAPVRSKRIDEENARQGTTDWQLTYTRVDPATKYRCPWIEGYVSRASVKAGDSLDLMVSTNPATPFTVDIYRMGYYGGRGGRLVQSLGPLEGTKQDDPPVGDERLRECRWQPSAQIKIGHDWPSGVYLGKLSLTKGRYQSYVVFIVRDEKPAPVLVQCSDNT